MEKFSSTLLSEDHNFLLNYNEDLLLRKINVSGSLLLDSLTENAIITQQEREILVNLVERCDLEKDDTLAVSKLLQFIRQKTEDHFQGFCTGLEVSKQSHIVANLLSKEAIQFAVKDFQGALCEHYDQAYVDDMHSWYDEEGRVALSDTYVPLEWVKYVQTNRGEKNAVPLKDYPDIFEKSISKILVHGDSAMGKSAFIKRITKDWSLVQSEKTVELEDFAALSRFSIVVPVVLCLVKNKATLEDTIAHQMNLTERQKLTLNWMLQTQADKVLVVMDGLGEYSEETSPEITRIMKGLKHKKLSIIITCRPEAAGKAETWNMVTFTKFGILGFSKKNIKSFIKKIMSLADAEKLIDYIFKKGNEAILELSKNPGNLCMMLILYKEDASKIVANREILYTEFIASKISHWEKKTQVKRTERAEIFKKYEDTLLKLGKLANTRNNNKMQLSFTEDEVRKCIGNGGLCYEFIKVEYVKSSFDNSRLFYHKLFQEYMAALYIYRSELQYFSQKCWNLDFFKSEMSLIRFILHLHLNKNEVCRFVRDVIETNPCKSTTFFELIISKILPGYMHRQAKEGLSFFYYGNNYFFAFPSYVLKVPVTGSYTLQQYNTNITVLEEPEIMSGISVSITDILVTRLCITGEVICEGETLYYEDISSCDRILCRPDYTVELNGKNMDLQILLISKIKLKNLNYDGFPNLAVLYLDYVYMHENMSCLKPCLNNLFVLLLSYSSLDGDDIKELVSILQSTTEETGKQCKTEALILAGNTLTGYGDEIVSLLSLMPMCFYTNFSDCKLNGEDFKTLCYFVESVNISSVPCKPSGIKVVDKLRSKFQTDAIQIRADQDLSVKDHQSQRKLSNPDLTRQVPKSSVAVETGHVPIEYIELRQNKLTGLTNEMTTLINTCSAVRLSQCSLTNDDLRKIVAGLKNLPTAQVQELYLDYNELSCTKTIIELSALLPHLFLLFLSLNQFPDEDFIYMAKYIKEHKPLLREWNIPTLRQDVMNEIQNILAVRMKDYNFIITGSNAIVNE